MSSFSFKHLFNGSLWVILSTLMTRLSGLFLLPILARLLSPEGLGLYNLIQNTIQTGDGLSRMGVDAAMHRNGAQYEYIGVESTGRLFGVGAILMAGVGSLIAAVICVNPRLIAQNFLGEPKVEPWLGLVAMTIFTLAVGNAPLSYLSALHAFRTYSIRTSTISVISAIITIILACLYGLSGSIWGLSIAAFIQLFLGWTLTLPILKEKKIKLRFDNFISQSCSILGFGLPFYASNFLSSFISLPLLGYVSHAGGLEQLGYLRVAQSLSQLISFLPTAIAPVLISALSANLASDPNEYQKIKSLHFRVLCSTMILISSVSSFSLDYLIPALFGSNYTQAIFLSRLTIWITVIGGISGMFGQYVTSAGKVKTIMIVQTTGLVINTILAILLIPNYSSVGLLFAQCISSLFISIAYIPSALMDLKPSDKKSLIFLLILTTGQITLCFGLPLVIQDLSLTLIVNITCFILTTILLSLKVFTPQEKNLVKMKFKHH
jgi:O-antigen/teichoic acid export membrane protein